MKTESPELRPPSIPQAQAAESLEYRTGPNPEPQLPSTGWIWIVAILVVAVGAFVTWRIVAGFTKAPEAKAARPVPVVTAAATKGNLPVYLNGLGTVTPLNTVTIRARVDGQINKVLFKEGQDVKVGDILVEIDPRPFQVQLQQAEGQQARDQALLNNAKRDMERYQSAGAAVTQQQIDTAKAQVAQYEGVIRTDQAQIDSARLQLTYAKVTAPLSGRIGLRMVDEGNMVHASDQNGLAVITQVQPITVLFTVPEIEIGRLLRQMNAQSALPVDAFDRDLKNKLASGVLTAIDNQVDPTTGTVRLKAEFANSQEMLFPNQFVNARLLVDTVKDATLAPSAAVQRGPDFSYVYVVQANQKVEARTIATGMSEGELTEITDGLAPGEIVVVDGVDKLKPGAEVTMRQGGGRAKGASTRSATRPRPDGEATSRESQ